ncbi:bromodomain-containing protein 8 isoform X2 [Ricinus communis]|uniref:bromodomain-containing protein 8 isoform X2 n=1 Tax=Ricinus communis TaxID=3988 RepID=UPI00201AB5BF|nr:bromodomain-containing protein 8 isoform X2 [Ricinus communis]
MLCVLRALFEELRKQRMAELKRALEKSEDSIGSLETKLETLKAARRIDSNVGCDSSQTESVMRFQKSDGVESSSKETSKGGLSAGSFTQETRTSWSPKCQVPASVSMEDIETKPEVSASPKQEKVLGIGNLAETFCMGQGGSIRRRRGKRKRKDCSKDMKEGSVGDSDFWGSTDVLSATRCKENSTSTSGQTVRCFVIEDKSRSSSKDEHADIIGIFDSIAENKCATVFRRRLDSQKRGRYKKMILQHMDIDTLRSRISSHSITTLKEVFRDLLLLANNALVFYSKTTREYKSALQLREIVTKSLQQHLKDYISKTTITLLSTTPQMLHPPVKPRSARPANRTSLGNVLKAGNTPAKTANAAKTRSNVQSPHSAESLTMIKKGYGRPRKAGRRSANQQPENLPKGRKRCRGR